MTATDFSGGVPRTTLNGAINNSVTTIEITDATSWPSPGSPFSARIFTATGSDSFLDFIDGETVSVTARTATTLTVTRGSDDTTAAAWSDGDHIMVIGPADIIQEHNDHANLTTGTPHGTAYLTTTTHGTASHAAINAGTATALETARTIALTGDVTYTSGSFDGTGNVTGAATIASAAVENSMTDFTWSAFTPTASQGAAVTMSLNNCEQCTLGDLVIATYRLTFSSAGTAANDVEITLPSAASEIRKIGGSAAFGDSGATIIGFPTGGSSTSAFKVLVPSVTVQNETLGQNETIATNDTLFALVVYEAA